MAIKDGNNMNLFGIYRQDLSAGKIQAYNNKYNPNNILIVPQQAVLFKRQEYSRTYLE